ncbi:pectate lyase superfamily protein-domain-containing protein [Aspergillus egyptiacus]|nr:pectate lyase superfamily protein-domain-containing protein [Aspergillus egyptiacus]
MATVRPWGFVLLLWTLLGFQALAHFSQLGHASHVHARQVLDSPGTVRALNASPDVIAKARALVKDAIAKAAVHNKARLDHPSRNHYALSPGTKFQALSAQSPDTESAPALFNVTEDIADAAALLAEFDAAAELNATGTVKRDYSHIDVLHKRQSKEKRAGTWWMGNKEHRGSWPWGDDSSYEVFRDVTDSKWATDGAAKCEPNGLVDCTKAINNAMKAGNRCGENCNGSTTKQAILYFPPGTYLVSGTIEIYFGTQMIGDANEWPVIKAAASFVGLGVFSTDHYVENGGTGPDGNALQWYINTANFYRQIRNFKFDIQLTDPNAYVCAVHYQVAQATSISNVDFIAAAPPTTQQAIYAENGSGGHMSDLTFTGGNFGIYGGSQQFTSQRLSFNNVNTAVQLIWDWGWTWKSISVTGGQTGFKLLSEDGVHHTGSLMVMDSVFDGTETAILSFPATTDIKKGTTGITLDNIVFNNVGVAVADNEGTTYLKGGTTKINTWTLGPIYLDPAEREFTLDKSMDTPRIEELLTSNDRGFLQSPYFERKKPQYEEVAWSDFISVKAQGAKGDGSTDDTATLQSILDGAGSSIVYFDAGTYILKDTLTIPNGARVVGEAWAQLVAEGSRFSDPENPRAVVKVGNKGDKGRVEIQDLLITTKGATAGAVLIEWNIEAEEAGAAGMWDTHTRIGGATGTELESAQCPASQTGVSEGCNAGSLMMHITEDASAYLENIWLWVADHDIDDPLLDDAQNNMVQCSVYVARGLLVESTAPTWLYGTSSEHAVYYQYNFYKARNVFAGLIQTESPYYQPTPNPPAPYENAVGTFSGDPDYTCDSDALGCDSSWAVRIVNSQDIFIAGAGLYSWFDTYDQSVCVDESNCQEVLVEIKDNYGGIRIHNLITIGATNMIVSDGTLIESKDNLNVDYHPYWSQVTVFDPKAYDEPPPETVCTPGSNSNPERPEEASGHYPPDTLVWPDKNPYQGYFILVNGSPYKWKVIYQHSYQMDTWNWYDVPAGESLQIEYQFKDDETRVDDKGEVTYEIEGTNKTFQVWARVEETDPRNNVLHLRVQYDNLETQDMPGGGSLELPHRWGFGSGYRSIPWVLTGSEEYGFWSSASPPTGWMGSIMDVIGPRKLKHVCMPGSHDAGMYKLDGKTTGANEENTITQYLNFYNQLRRGSRYFDVRPVVANADGDYYCGHYSNVLGYMQG